MAKAWLKAIILSIYKKGDIFECSNYRITALPKIVYKVLTTLIKVKLEIEAKKVSFWLSKDQIFLHQQTLITYKYGILVYVIFTDFKAAYDTLETANNIRKPENAT